MVEYSENAQKVYEKLYLKRNSLTEEIIENIEQCNERVSNYIADSKKEAKAFFEMLQNKSFRPNTPAMVNAGIVKNPNLSACFLLGLEDSMDSIIEMWATCARVYEGGGGAGIPISNLREKASPLSNGGHSSGPLSFLRTVQSISDQVKSGGRARRAANLASFNYKHPDALEFVKCKLANDEFSAINISLCVDEVFMTNLDSKNPIQCTTPNKLLANEKLESISYEKLWKTTIEAAWQSGDPGLLFIDRINEKNPLPSYGAIETTNPCGEVCLPPWSCCDLGHMNLNNFITLGKNGEIKFDTVKFAKGVNTAVKFLNRIIDKTSFPNERFSMQMKAIRPIGLGLMGFADVLYTLGIPYNSLEAKNLLATITKELTIQAFRSSIKLAKDEGIQIRIPDVDLEHFSSLLLSYGLNESDIASINEHGIANCTVTTLAPTGSTAISADCSYAFEPIFALVWEKNVSDTNETWFFIHPIFKRYCEDNQIRLSESLLKKINKNNGSILGLDEFDLETQKRFCTAHDIDWNDRLEMQAAAQNYITLSISSTVNLPNSATKEDIDKIYKKAYDLGLKGITVYRDGSKSNQPVNFAGSTEKETEFFIKRPMVRFGKTIEMDTPRGRLYLTGNYFDGKLMEVFVSMGHQGDFDNTLLNTIGRLISRSLQVGVPLEKLTDTMRGAGGQVMFVKIFEDGPMRNLTGVVDLIATLLDERFTDSDVIESSEKISNGDGYDRCPQCGKFTLTKTVGCRGGSCINSDCLYSCCI